MLNAWKLLIRNSKWIGKKIYYRILTGGRDNINNNNIYKKILHTLITLLSKETDADEKLTLLTCLVKHL